MRTRIGKDKSERSVNCKVRCAGQPKGQPSSDGPARPLLVSRFNTLWQLAKSLLSLGW